MRETDAIILQVATIYKICYAAVQMKEASIIQYLQQLVKSVTIFDMSLSESVCVIAHHSAVGKIVAIWDCEKKNIIKNLDGCWCRGKCSKMIRMGRLLMPEGTSDTILLQYTIGNTDVVLILWLLHCYCRNCLFLCKCRLPCVFVFASPNSLLFFFFFAPFPSPLYEVASQLHWGLIFPSSE